MAKKKQAKKKAKKPAKKVAVKKSTKKVAKKKSVKKKAIKKKTAKKKLITKKKTVPKTKPRNASSAKATAKPVAEPVRQEEAIGSVTHYYSHLNVAVVQLNTGTLKTGETIHIKGTSTDFMQVVESMEYEHQHIDMASAGQSIGLRVSEQAREHDIVYLVQ